METAGAAVSGIVLVQPIGLHDQLSKVLGSGRLRLRNERRQRPLTSDPARIAETIAAFRQSHPDLITPSGTYRGWVAGFTGTTFDDLPVAWDLTTAEHRLALYFLASAWSRLNKWEAAVRQVVAIQQIPGALTPGFWTAMRPDDQLSLDALVRTIGRRVKIANERPNGGRQDVYTSFQEIAKRFLDIEAAVMGLQDGTLTGAAAYKVLRTVRGSGMRARTWRIKLPLIFRELRCQGWTGIPKEVCGCPDTLVKRYYYPLGGLSQTTLKASARIVADFGELYDLPAFYAMLGHGRRACR